MQDWKNKTGLVLVLQQEPVTGQFHFLQKIIAPSQQTQLFAYYMDVNKSGSVLALGQFSGLDETGVGTPEISVWKWFDGLYQPMGVISDYEFGHEKPMQKIAASTADRNNIPQQNYQRIINRLSVEYFIAASTANSYWMGSRFNKLSAAKAFYRKEYFRYPDLI